MTPLSLPPTLRRLLLAVAVRGIVVLVVSTFLASRIDVALGRSGATLVSLLFVVVSVSASIVAAHRAWSRARTLEGSQRPDALRALRDTPRRTLRMLVAAEAAGAGLVGLVLTGESLECAVAVSLTLLGTSLVTVGPLITAWKIVLSQWIESATTAQPDPESLPELLPRVAAASVAGVGFLVVGPTVAVTPLSAFAVGTVGLLVVAFAAAFVARENGAALARFDDEATRLAERIRAATAARATERRDAVAAITAGLREPAIRRLGTAVALRVRSAEADGIAEESAVRSLEGVQRSKTVFMASMSHDLRGPLNSILGFSELLDSGVGGDLNESQLESVRLIHRSGAELLELLNDIIDSARFEAGRMPLRKAWTPSVEILTEAVRRGRELIEERGEDLAIEAELEPGLPPVHVDPERIVQAVLCLFRHAARAMDGGTVRLEARVWRTRDSRPARVRVDVIDHGGGIRGEDRDRIFEAFHAITSLSGKRIGGLGLSLALARSLVVAHGGDLSFESRENEGTTFTVALPIDGPPA